MPFALRRRNLSCFYCGQKTPHKPDGRAQQFECGNCEAVNYLDKDSQITDPPASTISSTTSSFRFAHIPDRPASPPPLPDIDSIFCQTCLKNQHLVKENLAAYLPPEDDPQYDTYLKSYDEYREKLEQRYPQVCSECKPKVKQQIMKTSYAAKADHLRRMMDRSRRGQGVGTSLGTAYDVMFRLAGVGWLLSIVLQACWHAMAAMSVPQQWSLDEYQESLYSGAPTPEECLYQAINSRKLHKACVAPATNWMPYVLLLSLTTIWWNRHLQTLYTRSGPSPTGIKEYYILQIVALAIRTMGWYFLRPDAPYLTGDMLKAGHLFLIMLIALTTVMSLNTIKLDFSPKVSFTIDESSLLPDVAERGSNNTTLDSSHPLRRVELHQPFPINKLAASTNNIYAQARQAPYKPPTPPSEDGYSDGEAMDWTPSSRPQASSFNPVMTRSAPTLFSAPTGASPFHGALPAAPQAPAHRLRKPAALQPGALRKVSETQKENFSAGFSGFGSRSTGTPSRQQRHNDFTTDEDTATEDEGGRTRKVGKKRREMEIANPKFWPQADLQKTTGLEALFEETLDMADTPTGMHGSGQKNAGAERSNPVWGSFNDMATEQAALPEATSWINPFTVGLVPIACMGAAVLIVKGGLI